MELKANPNRDAVGAVIEAQKDEGRGPVATILVRAGTLRKNDIFVVGDQWGKARELVDHSGQRVAAAGPSTPVEVLGLKGTPNAGDILNVVETVSQAKEISEYRMKLAKGQAQRRWRDRKPGIVQADAGREESGADERPQGRRESGCSRLCGSHHASLAQDRKRRSQGPSAALRNRRNHRYGHRPCRGIRGPRSRLQCPSESHGAEPGRPQGRRHTLFLGDLLARGRCEGGRFRAFVRGDQGDASRNAEILEVFKIPGVGPVAGCKVIEELCAARPASGCFATTW